MTNQRIGFIGTGQMACALARGLVSAGLYKPDAISGYDPSPDARNRFTTEIPGACIAASNGDLVRQADFIVLAVKPQQVAPVAGEVHDHINDTKLLISIAAGVTLATMSERFATQRVVRVMPNTPCLVGQGASGYALGPAASDDDAAAVHALMSAVGIAFRLDERYLDAVTGVSGSGPAFVYLFIEALSDGGVRAGLPRPFASALAAQTVRGAAEMVLAGDEHPAVLKDRVASPGGTTIAGLQTLEERGVRGAVIAAVVAAAERSRKLS